MIDIDETVKRLYRNPYESEAKPEHRCAQCGEGIYLFEEYYTLGGKDYCVGCVERKFSE